MCYTVPASLLVLEGFSCCLWNVLAGKGNKAETDDSKEGEKLPNLVPLETSYS